MADYSMLVVKYSYWSFNILLHFLEEVLRAVLAVLFDDPFNNYDQTELSTYKKGDREDLYILRMLI